ncbi:hypothetical protein GCM10010405_44110 [Streptomyces macrosporus]|uniref:Uncharacterized protein n=1 Tax=Streptomyces macrosporus TaxID=44032 RepID=A0ABP5XJ34_9ACTN
MPGPGRRLDLLRLRHGDHVAEPGLLDHVAEGPVLAVEAVRVTQATGSGEARARAVSTRASSVLVAKVRAWDTFAAARRSRSQVQDFGRYSSRSTSARPFSET